MNARVHEKMKSRAFRRPIDLVISEREVRQPDLIILHRGRAHVLTKRGCKGPPDAAVEMLAPSSVRRDRVHKTNVYARFGTPEYWVSTL